VEACARADARGRFEITSGSQRNEAIHFAGLKCHHGGLTEVVVFCITLART